MSLNTIVITDDCWPELPAALQAKHNQQFGRKAAIVCDRGAYGLAWGGIGVPTLSGKES